MSRPLALLLLLGIALTAVTAAPRRIGTPDQLEHLRRKLRELEGSLSDGDPTNQDVDVLLQDFVDKLDENDVHLLQDMPSKTPLLQKALRDQKDHPSPIDERQAQTEASVKGDTTPTQISLSTKPEQRSTPSRALPDEKTAKRCVGGNCNKFGKDLAPTRRGSNEDFDSYMANLDQQDSDLLNRFQSRLHLVREALQGPPTMENAKRNDGYFGDFVDLVLPTPSNPIGDWSEEPFPDHELGIVEESQCKGGNCEVQRSVRERSRKMAAEILKSSDSNPRLRALLERLRQERQHK